MARTALEPAEYPYFDYRRFTFSLGVAAGGRVWLSGCTAVRHDPVRGMVVEGDLVAQARVIFDKMRLALESGGLTLGNVRRLVRYVTPAALPDLPKLDAAMAGIFGAAKPAITTIVVKSLLRSEALIEIEGVAAATEGAIPMYLPSVSGTDLDAAWQGADGVLKARGLARKDIARAIELVTAPARTPDKTEFSAIQVMMPRVVENAAGAQIEIATADASEPKVLIVSAVGDASAGDVVGQCRDIYRRIGAVLRDAGANADSVVKTTEFVTSAGLAAYRKTGEVRRETFAPPYPAATGVVCEGLGAPGVQIAVEAVAVMEPR